MRTIPAREFSRRFHHGVSNHDGRYVWFLGAGCSVSSGISAAAKTAQRWLGELKYLETGNHDGSEAWGRKRFGLANDADIASLYGPALRALFFTAQEQERELERIISDAEPGFGYATLAQLMTHASTGERCNTLITTNFDDLAAEALYLYSQRRPQVLTHESFDKRIQISSSRPTIMKIYGDAHLIGAQAPESGAGSLRSDVMDRLRAQITEAAVVFMGYGGRDTSVTELFNGLPDGAPAGGIFWVNDHPPEGALFTWLEERNAMWVPHSDFEGLMYLLRREFALGHPRIDRFDQILKRYDEEYRVLAGRSDLNEAEPPAIETAATQAPGTQNPEAQKPEIQSPETRGPATQELAAQGKSGGFEPLAPPARISLAGPIHTISTPVSGAQNTANEQSLNPADAASGTDHLVEIEPEGPVEHHPVEHDIEPAEIATDGATMEQRADETLGGQADEDKTNDADKISDADNISDNDKTRDKKTDEHTAETNTATEPSPALEEPIFAAEAPVAPETPNPDVEAPLAPETPSPDAADPIEDTPQAWNIELPEIFEKSDVLNADEQLANVSVKSALTASNFDNQAMTTAQGLPQEANGRIDKLIAAAVEAMAADQDDALLEPENKKQESRARAALAADDAANSSEPPQTPGLSDAAAFKNSDAAAFKNNVTALRALPGSGLDVPRRLLGRSDAAALDRRYLAALKDSPKNAKLLSRYAQFLATGKRDHDAAEHYFNRAVDADPLDAESLLAFAKFLTTIRRDLDRAEDCYRLALRADYEDPTTLCAYGEFLWLARQDFQAAGECYQVAVDAAPRDADALSAYARFLHVVEANTDAAFALLKLAVASTRTDPAPSIELAEFLATTRGDLEKAEKTLLHALRIAPDSPETLAAAGTFYADKLDKYSHAQGLFEQAINADPDEPAVLRAYADFAARHANDGDKAERLLRRAVDADPGNTATALAFARFLESFRNDLEEADKQFRRAVHLDPRNATALAEYARFQQDVRNNPAGAEERYEKALKIDPGNVIALVGHAHLLMTERDAPKKAEQLLQRALAVDPRNASALSNLGKILRDRGETVAAEEMFQRAVDLDPRRGATLGRYVRKRTQPAAPKPDVPKFDAPKADAPKIDDVPAAQNTPATQDTTATLKERHPLAEAENAHALTRAAKDMFSQSREEEGRDLLDRAFHCALNADAAERDSNLLLELWVCRFAFKTEARSDAAKAIMWLSKAGARLGLDTIEALLDIPLAKEHSEPELLREIAAIATGKRSPDGLQRFNVA